MAVCNVNKNRVIAIKFTTRDVLTSQGLLQSFENVMAESGREIVSYAEDNNAAFFIVSTPSPQAK